MAAVTLARRPYRPQAHPGRRDRWSPPAILAALREWVELTGRPPRRQDWSGERPGRAGESQRRWMREHPRWPSSSCVARHFGSWSEALEQAGLEARRLTFPTTVSERVLAARALAEAGHGLSEIARRLGVSRSSAYNYLCARDCPGCGAPLPSPTADACRECTRHLPSVARAWTREDALDAIRDWTDEHGRPPTYRDWTPSRHQPGRWEAESPRWPSAAAVCACYPDSAEPWLTALRDSVGHADDHIRRLDDRRHLRSLSEPELARGLDGDRGDEPDAVAVELDVGRRRTLGDPGDGGGQLVACAELHGSAA
ncbi:homing endonuclease associated repeat-containing protein [Solirubrobacter soli]|uniref:homing endonuclease associated repeat-containing protein n=1 Tax=Solirubrobacter soli TaxID=363832 RepID=UPI0004234EEF|nr:helix-turn-helix domain-containing protein [Solirubrobacter soli]